MGMELKRVLFAGDGSEGATLAARAAADVSGRAGARLHVVHAWRSLTPLVHGAANAPEDRPPGEDGARRVLDGVMAEVERAGGLPAEAHLREGDLSEAVNGLARELDADLVVVGGRGAGAVARLLDDSVSEGVVRGAHCPVLVVRGGDEAWPPRGVVVGDDSSEASGDAGRVAAGLGGLFGAPVVLVRALHHNRLTRSAFSRGPGRAEWMIEASTRSMKERGADLDRFADGEPDVEVRVGEPVSAIRAVAEARGPGALVAVGSRGLGGVGRFVLGSVSTDVLRSAEGPVLVAPPGGDRDG